MTVTAEELAQFEGKRVIVTIKTDDGKLDEVEGFADKANALGLLFKPKGKSTLDIVGVDDIEQIVLIPEPIKALKARYIKDADEEGVRAHLIASHGVTLTVVNSMTDKAALEWHATIDHTDLGHIHGEKPAKVEAPVEEAVVAAE